MMLDERTRLGSYLTQLLSKGQVHFSAAQAQQALGISKNALLKAAEKQQKRGNLISPRRGFYVIVPPEYRALGALEPPWYIDALMAHEQRPYYVALLKAAELHGATHQAVMEFQVVTDKQLPKIRAGRSSIVFYYRKDLSAVARGLQKHQTKTGTMNISGPELTALDLVRYPHAAGGLHHIATVLSDLGDRIDAEKLAVLSGAFERSVRQRLGFLLGISGHGEIADPMHARLAEGPPLPWVELEPPLAADPDLAPLVVERSERWHVIGRNAPEKET
jgi:predicted transcriptional regulator of viral defense system